LSKASRLSISVLSLLFAIVPLSAQSLDVTEILERFYQQQDVGYDQEIGAPLNQVVTYRYELQKEGEEPNIAQSTLYNKTTERRIVIYRDQNEKATVILVLNDTQWLYQKGLRRPLRITKSYAIQDNVDLADILGIDYRYDYEIIAEEYTDEHIVVSLRATDAQLRYRFVDLTISIATQDIIAIDYKSVSERVIRSADISYYSFGARRLPRYLFSPAVLAEERIATQLEITAINEQTLPDSFFAPNAIALTQVIDFLGE